MYTVKCSPLYSELAHCTLHTAHRAKCHVIVLGLLAKSLSLEVIGGAINSQKRTAKCTDDCRM